MNKEDHKTNWSERFDKELAKQLVGTDSPKNTALALVVLDLLAFYENVDKTARRAAIERCKRACEERVGAPWEGLDRIEALREAVYKRFHALQVCALLEALDAQATA